MENSINLSQLERDSQRDLEEAKNDLKHGITDSAILRAAEVVKRHRAVVNACDKVRQLRREIVDLNLEV